MQSVFANTSHHTMLRGMPCALGIARWPSRAWCLGWRRTGSCQSGSAWTRACDGSCGRKHGSGWSAAFPQQACPPTAFPLGFSSCFNTDHTRTWKVQGFSTGSIWLFFSSYQRVQRHQLRTMPSSSGSMSTSMQVPSSAVKLNVTLVMLLSSAVAGCS